MKNIAFDETPLKGDEMFSTDEMKQIVANLKARQAKRFEEHVDDALAFFRKPEETMASMEIEIYEELIQHDEKAQASE